MSKKINPEDEEFNRLVAEHLKLTKVNLELVKALSKKLMAVYNKANKEAKLGQIVAPEIKKYLPAFYNRHLN